MNTYAEHIASAFDQELHKLDGMIDQMAGLAEAQLDRALHALAKGNGDVAQTVMTSDRAVDEIYAQIQAQALKVLVLRSPVADDLRRVVSALKIAGEIERIGDIAANCAKRVMVLSQGAPPSTVGGLVRLGRTVQERLKSCFDALRALDCDAAALVRENDADVDAHYSTLFREILTYMMEDPRTITACTHLLFMAKNLERIGDHATNIAEEIVFMVTGKAMEAERPKADTTIV